jgi:FkbM family methyltransferase
MALFRSDGRRALTWLERILLSLSARARRLLQRKIRLDENGFRSVYVCSTTWDAKRPVALWLKEEATMRWIHDEVHAGSIFMDVGANIGVYTIAAAHRVGATGRVYAFEPHKVNAVSLMQNLALSDLADRVDVFTFPLSDQPGVVRFNYVSLASASSGSQLGHTRVAGKEKNFAPVASEMSPATTVDALINDGTISPPALIKIDVDGNELAILRGMQALLKGPGKPRAVLVEINPGQDAAVGALMTECGYQLDARHFTSAAMAKRRDGSSEDQIEHNALFRPRPTQ